MRLPVLPSPVIPFFLFFPSPPPTLSVEARDSEWQWHQLGHMQVCTSLQTDSHTSTPPLTFLQAGCPSCRPPLSVYLSYFYLVSFSPFFFLITPTFIAIQ